MSTEETATGSASAPLNRIDSDFPQMPIAWPGTKTLIVFLSRWLGEDERNGAPPTGTSGFYRVVCTLGKPGAAEVEEGQVLSSDKLSGASYIRVLKHEHSDQRENFAVRFELTAAVGALECIGYINKYGCLAKIAAHRVQADTFSQAEAIFTDALKRWLSSTSIALDVPVELASVHTIELKTGNHQLEHFAPVHEQSWAAIPRFQNSPEYAFYASLYREGTNSNSPVYEFLCFFKVLEGLFARRERLNQELVARGGTPRHFRERLPFVYDDAVAFLKLLFRDVTWNKEIIDTIFIREVAGKRLSGILKEKMRPLRNGVAHGVFGASELTVDVDAELHVREVRRWLPITKVLVRYLLREEFPAEFDATGAGTLELIPVTDAEPKDDVFQSPTISNIQVRTSIVRVPDSPEGLVSK